MVINYESEDGKMNKTILPSDQDGTMSKAIYLSGVEDGNMNNYIGGQWVTSGSDRKEAVFNESAGFYPGDQRPGRYAG